MFSRLWIDSVLHLPNTFWRAYSEELSQHSLLDRAKAGTSDNAVHGGQSVEATEEHFCFRFGTSGSRIAFIIVDPKNAFSEAQQNLLQSFSDGSLAILDLACGAGAASLSALTTIAELRSARQIPPLPLNVHIFGADFSPRALDFFQSVLPRVHRDLSASGISLTFDVRSADLLSQESMNALCDDWFTRCALGSTNDYLVLIANISGIPKDSWTAAERSLSHIVARTSNKPSAVLWIEPGSGTSISFFKRIVSNVLNFFSPFGGNTSSANPVEYKWRDQVVGKEVRSFAQVIQYKRKF